MQQPEDMTAHMLIAGDVILEDSPPALILHREDKQIDGRIRFTLVRQEAGKCVRFHRTYNPGRLLRVYPMGAGRILQECRPLCQALGVFVDTQA